MALMPFSLPFAELTLSIMPLTGCADPSELGSIPYVASGLRIQITLRWVKIFL